MIYKFNDEEYKTREEVEDTIQEFAEDNYDDLLDECYEVIHIGDLTYYPSQVLKEVDPVAYRCGILDYADSLWGDVEEIEEVEEA